MLKKYMTFCAIAMIAFSSCQEQIPVPDNGAVAYPVEKTFYSVDAFSKVLLNSTQVLWEKGDKIDHFRRLANDMIRLYCHYRNCDVSKEENAKEFEQKAMEMNRISLISEDSVKKFTLR